MARTVELTPNEIVIRLTGLEQIAAFKGEICIPYDAVRAVTAGRFQMPSGTLRLGGTSIPFTDIREGRFWSRDGGWSFLSYEDADKTVALELDGRENSGRAYRAVVVEVDDPETIRAEIVARAAEFGLEPAGWAGVVADHP